MKTDRIRTDIINIIFVFAFLSKFEFENRVSTMSVGRIDYIGWAWSSAKLPTTEVKIIQLNNCSSHLDKKLSIGFYLHGYTRHFPFVYLSSSKLVKAKKMDS